jgi:7,8-dihydropterin-6-yl-methyl-4-(beta-D-ribofuranosyl)aminobenzene 5'-phosphate synthase
MPKIKYINNNQPGIVNITVIYDNNPLLKDLQTDWGFACLVEVGETRILFDTGDKGDILLSNMEKLGIEPRSIEIVFLSHFHHDHTGGLKEFLNANSNVKLFYPQSFPAEIINVIKLSGAASFPVTSSMEILSNVFTLGEIEGTISEQSLAIRSRMGIVVITGCAHPGIINILQKAKNEFPGELIFLSMGGFHLRHLNEDEINKVIQKIHDMDILTVAPTHCTGSTARKMFKKVFDVNNIEIGAGKVFKIDY